jgi:hypothetical protein
MTMALALCCVSLLAPAPIHRSPVRSRPVPESVRSRPVVMTDEIIEALREQNKQLIATARYLSTPIPIDTSLPASPSPSPAFELPAVTVPELPEVTDLTRRRLLTAFGVLAATAAAAGSTPFGSQVLANPEKYVNDLPGAATKAAFSGAIAARQSELAKS